MDFTEYARLIYLHHIHMSTSSSLSIAVSFTSHCILATIVVALVSVLFPLHIALLPVLFLHY